MTTGEPSVADWRFALVCSRFNDLVVERLERGARQAFVRRGIPDHAVDTFWAPGALELPIVAKAAADTRRYDAIVALGAVVRGATYHFEVVADQSAAGLVHVALDAGIVVTNGIVTVDTLEQALDRAGGKSGNKGADAASAALETVELTRTIRAG